MNYFSEYSLLALTISSATKCSWPDDGLNSITSPLAPVDASFMLSNDALQKRCNVFFLPFLGLGDKLTS